MSREREEFSVRLRTALKEAGHASYGPTELAHQFNARFPGSPITVHAARKWLMGESIPTQEKIRVIAKWLAVPADWLRFGGYESPHDGPISQDHIDPVYQSLISDLQCLDAYNRKLVLEFVRLVTRLHTNGKS